MYSSITPNKFCTLPQFSDNTHKMFFAICSLLYNNKFMIIELAKKPKELEFFFSVQVPRQAKRSLIFHVSLARLCIDINSHTTILKCILCPQLHGVSKLGMISAPSIRSVDARLLWVHSFHFLIVFGCKHRKVDSS